MKTSMRMEWMFITPVQAASWLEKNLNRKLRPEHVRRIATDMANGHFRYTHEPIALYEDGSLADGQHRLNAIIQSETVQWMWVCFGVPLASRDAIGGVVTRSNFDQITIAGHDVPRTAIDIIKCVQGVATNNNHKMTTPQIVGFWSLHKEAILWTIGQFPKRLPKVSQAAVLSVVFRAYYSADLDRLKAFCDDMNSGACRSSADDGARVLRNWLFSTKNPLRLDVYQKTESGLSGYLRKTPMTKVYGFSSEQFPLPEETEPEAVRKTTSEKSAA